ncbi:AAA family ATPase [Gluconobacter wancherniae]|uniref:AAA family ATPase n=1 Tax=Gluconobacter wancherniae TaxID=1307955 RepID=UPI0030A6D1AC
MLIRRCFDDGEEVMRIKNLKLNKFRRFLDLEIKDIPETVKLVVMAGSNGSGKSSLFDAMLLRYRINSQLGYNADLRYYNRPVDPDTALGERVSIKMHDGALFARGSLYIRSAHRHDPDFATSSLSRQGDILEKFTLRRLIESDATVAQNYARLAAHAMEDVFVNEAASTTMGAYRDKLIGEIREPLLRLFPDLVFLGVGNPLNDGTFLFKKGKATSFDYKNLSGGEKAAFDLILDFTVKRKSYPNAIYCIDEPEMHMNTKVQGALLSELLGLLPEESQLWIASHSIGMMRRARELYDANPSLVAFLDFSGRDFDKPTVITPSKPSRAFWEGVMNVALDDLATLVAPREVVICEGNPASAVPGKNVEHDARVYSTIFAEELPDVTFISAGSANQVSGDFLALATTLPKVVTGMKIRRVIDLDDHAPSDVDTYKQKGIIVLGRRHIEAYLFDDEVLTALCHSVSKSDEAPAVLAAKQQAISDSIGRGNPADDIKSAAGKIYTETKRLLNLTQVGNDCNAFARNTLAPLVKPGMIIYANLKSDIFNL